MRSPVIQLTSVLCLAACSRSPVDATSCSVERGPGRSFMAKAVFTNRASKVTSGVELIIVLRRGQIDTTRTEYPFKVALLPEETQDVSELISYDRVRDLVVRKARVAYPGPTERHIGAGDECSVTGVYFEDGSAWHAPEYP